MSERRIQNAAPLARSERRIQNTEEAGFYLPGLGRVKEFVPSQLRPHRSQSASHPHIQPQRFKVAHNSTLNKTVSYDTIKNIIRARTPSRGR